jgi:predicted kinase
MDEVAFLFMDLLHGQRPDLAYRFLNAYLEATGDFVGVSVLRFYIAYRAGVRAKVNAIRAFQPGANQQARMQSLTACRNYLALAGEYLSMCRPALIITHGLPGSGKSTFAQAALERIQAIRIRSDVERKRIFGMHPLEDSRLRADNDIYSGDATRRTYTRLHELARKVLEAGFPVIVDAAFLKQDEREQFRALAAGLSVPYVIVSMRTSTATLGARIIQRRDAANDASEADLAVLKMLQTAQQPLLPHEIARTVEFLNDADQSGISADAAGWARMEALLMGTL